MKIEQYSATRLGLLLAGLLACGGGGGTGPAGGSDGGGTTSTVSCLASAARGQDTCYEYKGTYDASQESLLQTGCQGTYSAGPCPASANNGASGGSAEVGRCTLPQAFLPPALVGSTSSLVEVFYPPGFDQSGSQGTCAGDGGTWAP